MAKVIKIKPTQNRKPKLNKIKFSEERIAKKCVICSQLFEGLGNNPYPVKRQGQCCDRCNETVVMPARAMMN